MAPLAQVPALPWATLLARLKRDWHPGQHVTIIGPTRSGKTHIALALVELCRYVLVLACKRQDPLVSDLVRHGYHVTGDLDGLLWTADDERAREPLNRRVVFWPQFPEKTPRSARIALQARAMGGALDWADRTGGWAVVVDETMWMCANLKLQKELEAAWFQGRTQGLSVVALAQRPAHIPRLAFSSADYLFLAKTGDGRDVENLREISSSIPRELIEQNLASLDKAKHEFLFVDTVRDDLARVIAPPR